MQIVQETETGLKSNFTISNRGAEHIATLLKAGDNGNFFRVAVNGGGCSGFQYEFKFEDAANEDDIIIANGEAKVLVDEVSLPFLENAQLDWKEDLLGSYFRVVNPNARSSCGCGMSFSV